VEKTVNRRKSFVKVKLDDRNILFHAVIASAAKQSMTEALNPPPHPAKLLHT
jgi:hypothetical protein